MLKVCFSYLYVFVGKIFPDNQVAKIRNLCYRENGESSDVDGLSYGNAIASGDPFVMN